MSRERRRQYERLEVELGPVKSFKYKLGLNREMYSWVDYFLNYFISISERHRNRKMRGGGGGKVKSFYLFIYFFL